MAAFPGDGGKGVSVSTAMIPRRYKRWELRVVSSVSRILGEAEDVNLCTTKTILVKLRREYGKAFVYHYKSEIESYIASVVALIDFPQGKSSPSIGESCRYNSNPYVLPTSKRRRTETSRAAFGHESKSEISVVENSGLGGAVGVLTGGSSGYLYVSDETDRCIHCFDPKGVFLRKWAIAEPGVDLGELCLAIGSVDSVSPLLVDALQTVPALGCFHLPLIQLCASYFGEDYICVNELYNTSLTVYNAYGMRLRSIKLDHLAHYSWCIGPLDGLIYVAHKGPITSDREGGELSSGIALQILRPDGDLVRKVDLAHDSDFAPTIASLVMSDTVPERLWTIVDGEIYCFDSTSGSLVQRLPNNLNSLPETLAVRSGLLYVFYMVGVVRVYQPSGEIVGEYRHHYQNCEFSGAAEPSAPLYIVDCQYNQICLIPTDTAGVPSLAPGVSGPLRG